MAAEQTKTLVLNADDSLEKGKLIQKDDEIQEQKPTLETMKTMLKYTGGYTWLAIQILVIAFQYNLGLYSSRMI